MFAPAPARAQEWYDCSKGERALRRISRSVRGSVPPQSEAAAARLAVPTYGTLEPRYFHILRLAEVSSA